MNGYTLNGSTGERKPALTVTSRVYVKDSSKAQTGTIMREDTKENSGVSSHYVIDVQGGNSGWLFFQSGNVKNDSGALANIASLPGKTIFVAAHRAKAREFATMRLHVEDGVLAEAR